MPRRDKTRPAGKGPMTGRGMGKCNVNGIANAIDSAIIPRGGMGRGWRMRW